MRVCVCVTTCVYVCAKINVLVSRREYDCVANARDGYCNGKPSFIWILMLMSIKINRRNR